ncbi:acetylserotonin O-methyltransferase [Streptomyces sp. MST-110588]|uniref:acetylserotonin O-methyltransferase n=1 Tax=Streptomyces sp. MST-110588 TaxID=2833628 RepID=UPI001F5CA7C6|nr:acetylserotonin O-methyltransferase [Streptomyces sp. MST-110588]UNO43285.1 methyltransferase domain-containing protein [Streptomyces sp. MST-110588]
MPSPQPAVPALSPLPLMHLATGFWAFKALASANELGLFGLLDRMGGATVEECAEELEVSARPAGMLLTACTALGLLQRRPDRRFVNSALADAYLVPGRPYHFGGWVRMLDQRLYPGWGKLTEAVRNNRPTTWDPETQPHLFNTEDPDLLSVFWEAMHAVSSWTAQRLGSVVDLASRSRLLDVGGGSGAYAIELCRRHPDLRATVYDLPGVCPAAARNAEAAGLADRIATFPGDFLAEPALPGGHDVIVLSMILHDWDEETNRTLLGKCYAALPPGGELVISELMVDDDLTGPATAALMSLNMLVETEGGRNYTAAQYADWLTDAGFTHTRKVPMEAPGANAALVAVR